MEIFSPELLAELFAEITPDGRIKVGDFERDLTDDERRAIAAGALSGLSVTGRSSDFDGR